MGTGFHGWQAQATLPTIQGLMDGALKVIGHRGARIVGCSRTDAGVHARRYTAHLDTILIRPLPNLLKGLNANLPPTVRVHRIAREAPLFHARFSCLSKTYRYHLYRGEVVPPGLSPYVVRWPGELDTAAMAGAGRVLLGEHDFAAFTTAEGRKGNTRRTLTRCDWRTGEELLVLQVSGPSFLHRMVRCLAGAMVAVGRGRISARDLAALLTESAENPQIPAMPAQGLVLWEVCYAEGESSLEAWGKHPEADGFPP